MLTRIISASVMAPIAFATIWYGSPFFKILVIAVACAATFEWRNMLIQDEYGVRHLIRLALGLLYILIPCLILIWLRNIDIHGRQIIIWLFAVIWATDIGAYFLGKALGGPKLAPKISPNKTWAGFLGGLILAGLVSIGLVDIFDPPFEFSGFVVASLLLSIVGQLGDLLQSWVKRSLNLKDSGTLIPGHGGVLDRIDAILLATPVAGIIIIYFHIGEVPWK